MNLDLTDEETAALTQELHNIVENDRYPFSPRIRTLRGHSGDAQAGARPRAVATTEGVRAAASCRSQTAAGIRYQPDRL